MMATVGAEQFVSMRVVGVWERFARSGSEENINEGLEPRVT
jgi:hypothetical protein